MSSRRGTARRPRLKDLSRLETATLAQWIAKLRAVWEALGFPWKGGSEGIRTTSASAEDSMMKALAELEHFAGDVKVSADEALEWLQTACSAQQVVEAGAESGGIQVLNPAGGLRHPLRRALGGGLSRGRPAFARPGVAPPHPRRGAPAGRRSPTRSPGRTRQRRLAALRALCSEDRSISFTRAFQEPGGDPFLPSPFMKDELRKMTVREGETEKQKDVPFTFDVWDAEMPRWLAAPWLEGTVRGLRCPVPPAPPEPARLLGALPAEMGVSSLKGLMNCPYQFFATDLLGLSLLPAPPDGISPLVRGNLVHEILKEFMQAVRDSEARLVAGGRAGRVGRAVGNGQEEARRGARPRMGSRAPAPPGRQRRG